MGRGISIRARLILSLTAIVVGVLALSGTVGVIRFDSMIKKQAQQTLDTNMAVASGLLDDQVASVGKMVADTASDRNLPFGNLNAGLELYNELAQQADRGGLTYFAVVRSNGAVSGTSLGSGPYTTTWGPLVKWATDRTAVTGVALVPQADLEAVGLANRLQLAAKETPKGTVVAGEDRGALAIISVAPVDGGILLGVKVLKLNNDLVDSVVAKVGGTSTVFQGGVRIATTVKNDAGERAIGTVVSDQVRATTLKGGQQFKGETFVVSKKYLTNYVPLKDPTGATAGMLFVGVDNTPYAAATRNFAFLFGGAILLGLGFALLGAFTVSRTISRPLSSMSDAADEVATGDLTAHVPTVGYREVRALGDAFNTMTGGLKTIIAQVEESVHQLRSVSAQISAASRSSAEHATRQASSVAETTATLEELTRSFQAVSDGARRVLNVAEDSLESAQGGVSAVDRTHDAMDKLANGARDMADAAGAMSTVAEEITEMTSLITGISGQTKILALNAAIEAARAGEAGKGFAVVSSEIRSLADSVAQSATRIAEMVNGIQEASSRLQNAARQQSDLSDSAVGNSEESRRTFSLIVQQMEDTAMAAREIAEATVQQTRASDQLVEAMHQVSISSTETAAAARQLADSANSVEGEAEGLLRGLTRFKTH